jgi:hypothetical protein
MGARVDDAAAHALRASRDKQTGHYIGRTAAAIPSFPDTIAFVTFDETEVTPLARLTGLSLHEIEVTRHPRSISIIFSLT